MPFRLPFARKERAPVLVILHQASSCAGALPSAFERLGAKLDVRRPRLGDTLPSTLSRHSGAVVLGGPMSANDTDDWLRREIDWLAVPLRERAPLLGICLGGQMMSKHLGGKVYVRSDGRGQIGHHRLELTDVGRTLLGTPPGGQAFHWHREGFTVPEGARLLAFDEHFAQAFAYGENAIALQFHPEADARVVSRWMAEDPAAASVPGARPFASLLPGQACLAKAQSRWLAGFVAAWLDRDPRDVGPALGQKVRDGQPSVQYDRSLDVALSRAE